MTMTDPTTETTLPPGEVKISIMGSDVITVGITGTGTVAEVVATAAELLGVEINPDRVAFVKDGQQVAPDAPVAAGQQVTAAPRVANG